MSATGHHLPMIAKVAAEQAAQKRAEHDEHDRADERSARGRRAPSAHLPSHRPITTVPTPTKPGISAQAYAQLSQLPVWFCQ